jgi:hypothetical protein
MPMKNRRLLIRFVEPNEQDNIVQCFMNPRHLLNPYTLDKYVDILDLNIFDLYTDPAYGRQIYKIFKNFIYTSYKVMIMLHANPYDEFISDFNNKKIDVYSLIMYLKSLNKPIEILNLSCYVRLGKYINELPEGSLIIDVGNGQLVDYRVMIHDMYENKRFHDYFYGNEINFYKILALYTLFNTAITNDKPAIYTMKSTFDIDIEIKRFTIYDLSGVLANEFIKLLRDYRRITPVMLKCIHHVLDNNNNYSFYYTFAQFHIDMKHVDFPNNIISKYDKYYPQQGLDLKVVKINQKLYESYLGYKAKNINPFILLYTLKINNEDDTEYVKDYDDTGYVNDYDDYIQLITPLYSYQKFIAIVMKYIK